MAAVLPIDAPMLSSLRARLLEDAETRMALATVRAALLLHGVRGVEGMRWLAQELVKPGVFEWLPSSDPEATANILAAIVKRHEGEVKRREEAGSPSSEARKFSQHRQGRHGGQSGKWWLDAAATESGSANFSRSVFSVLVVMPVFGWEQKKEPYAMQDHDVADLLCSLKGVFPFVREQAAADYTTMDVGRTIFLIGVLLRRVVPCSLGPSAFETFLHCQSPNTRKVWAACGIESHEDFRQLEAKLREAMAVAAVVKLLPMPTRFPPEAIVTWGAVATHICEYKQASNEPGGAESIRMAVSGLPTNAETTVIANTMRALAEGGSPCSSSGVPWPGRRGRGQRGGGPLL